MVIDEIRDLAESQVIRTGQEREPHWNDRPKHGSLRRRRP